MLEQRKPITDALRRDEEKVSAPQDGFVPFTVRLADGSEHQIEIDGYVLRNGDCIALSMAIEHQEAGRIPRGDILSVRRVGI